MYTISFFALFFLGLAFGSFLNVVALRYSPENRVFSLRRISGRSYCPKCKVTLRWYELLPLISFVFLWGRCRTCKEKISWQYPIVEFLSGLLFVFVLFKSYEYTNPIRIYELIFLIVIFWFLLLMSVIDIRHYIIPNAINIILLFLGAVAIFLKTLLPPFQQFFVGSYAILFELPMYEFGTNVRISVLTLGTYHVFGALVGGGFFWAVHALTRGKGMGFGDVKLGFALGFLLGWPDILFAMMFAFIVGGAWGVVALLLRRKGFKSRLPFGPFFAVGTAIVVFFGQEILQWYFALFQV